jgi:hypothetical protein
MRAVVHRQNEAVEDLDGEADGLDQIGGERRDTA